MRLARTAGFCMGVRRAMELVLAEGKRKDQPLVTYGPLIHNRQVLQILESKGIIPIDDLHGIRGHRVVIRAHGIPPQERKAIKEGGARILDATCPRVARVQAIIRYYTNKGYAPVIVGDKDHPEVIGLVGYSRGQAYVVQGPEDVASLPPLKSPFVVAQTTQSERVFRTVVRRLRERFSELLVFDTICEATHQRQDEIKTLAQQVDAMVVVGGFHSGNTRRLVQASKSMGVPTFHVETVKDIQKEQLAQNKVIGVTAGASTPNWMIKSVIEEIEGIKSTREGLLGRWTKKALKFFLLSNLLAALGAYSLSLAISVLLGRSLELQYPFLAFCYVYAMHVLNRFLDKEASAYNDPERAHFLARFRVPLISMGIAFTVMSLAISAQMGVATFVAMAILNILGIVYSIQLLPRSLYRLAPYSKMKDIPGSKTFSEGLAWAAVIVVLPLLNGPKIRWAPVLISFFAVFSVSYTRSALFDIFQIQGDLIVGIETLPIVLGEKRTLFFLKTILLTCALLLVVSPLFRWIPFFSYVLLACLLPFWGCLWAYERRKFYPGSGLEALIEISFLLPGIFALIWRALSWPV